MEPWWSLGVALGWPWGGFEVALRWLCTPESMPSICLQYGLGVALGGLRRLASIPAFCFCWSVALGGFTLAHMHGGFRDMS